MIYFQKEMRNKIFLFLIAISGMLVLSSCSDIKKIVGLEKETPNEFLIEKRESLTLPPDYKMLPPDSQTNTQQAKESKNSLKEILDKDSRKKEPERKSANDSTAGIEKEILKQIK
jgi:hypothetical protein